MTKTDEILMLECSRGDKEALEVLYNKYKKRIFNFSYRMLNNRADAEEVTGDFFAIISDSPHYSISAKFTTWAYAVARNLCVSRLRKKVRWQFLWFEISDPSLNHAELIADEDIAVKVRQAINELAEKYKTVIVLREYEKLSYSEIAAVMECSQEQVKTNIFRAREKLRFILAPLVKEVDNA